MTEPAGNGPAALPMLGPFDSCSSLESFLGLERVGGEWRNRAALLNIVGQIMGGQLAAHCLTAIAADHPATRPASLHTLFVTAGDPRIPYGVVGRTIRAGRNLSQHAVTVHQGDRVLAEATMVSAATDSAALPGMPRYGRTAPAVAGPEQSWPRATILADHAAELAPGDKMLLRCYDFLEIRDVEGFARLARPMPGRACFWLRIPLAAGLGAIDQYALLTLATDFWYALPMYSHVEDRAAAMASYVVTSIDHAVWFHAAPRCDEWLLVESELLVSTGGGSVHRASIFDSSGNSIATVVQEGIARAGGLRG